MDAVVTETLTRIHAYTPIPVDAHMYACFGSPWPATRRPTTPIMWDKVISEDFFGQFDSRTCWPDEAPERYRRVVLEPGGSMSANDLVKNFLGRPQNMEALQQWMSEDSRAQANLPQPAVK